MLCKIQKNVFKYKILFVNIFFKVTEHKIQFLYLKYKFCLLKRNLYSQNLLLQVSLLLDSQLQAVSYFCDRVIEEDGDGSRVLVELMLSETRKSDTVIPLDEYPDLPHSGELGFVKFLKIAAVFILCTTVCLNKNLCV